MENTTDAGAIVLPAVLPCPFCGSADPLRLMSDNNPVAQSKYSLECSRCGAQGPKANQTSAGYSGDRGLHVELTKLWNRRA